MECDIFQEAQAFQQYVKEFENQISKTLIFNNEDLKILIYSNADYQGLYEKLKKMLIPLKDDLSIYIPKKILNHDDREIVQTCSMSLLSKLLYISIYDTEGILNFWLIDVQRTYLLTLYEHQRWCYTILITVYTSILEQGVLWNPEVNEKTKTLIFSYGQNSNLSDVQNVPKIILTSQYHVDNLIKVCLSVLDYIVPQYCNMDVDKDNPQNEPVNLFSNMLKVVLDDVDYTLETVDCIINLCDNNNSLLNQKMVSIVALPFYQTLKKSPHIRKLPWLHNEMKKLPKKLVEFFESQFERKQEIILKMKATSIINLSQFSLQPNCWVLVKSIMESVISQNDIEQKSALYSNFTSFAVNNSGKLQEVLTLYQNFLMELKDVQLTIQPLRDMLCLSGGHLSIFKMHKEYHIYDYKIVCDDCILVSTIYPKSMKSLDIHRHMAFIKDLNAILISSDPFKNAQQNLQISASNLISQSNEFKMKLFSHIPSMITHSKDFITWIQQDKGKSFFEGIYLPNDKFVEELEKNLKDILCNIQKLPFSEKLKLEIFENFFFTNIGELTQLTVSGNKNDKLQSLTIKMNFTYSTIVVDELTMVKCFKIFLLYILRYDSQVKAEASLLALEMAKRNKITLQQLFQWHKTFIMRYVTYIIIANYLAENISLSTSIINLLRYLNISKLRDFLPKTIGTIIAYLLPRAVQSPVIMKSLTDLCGMLGPLDKEQNLSDAIDKNLLEIYHHIYTSHPKNVTENCVKFIEDRIQMNIYKRFASHKKKTVDEVLMFYNKSPEFVAEIFKHSINDRSSSLFSDDDDEEMIESITTRFLGVLIYFEPFLTSNDCERVTKKNILLSLGDIIRLLGDSRISPFCFKIITVLKTAAEQKTFDLSDVCIKVWEILIRNCDVTFLGPILSTVFVSLEAFIDRYPDEVHELYSYLVVSNRNLLSCHISNLFFIEKTRVHSDIKAIITEQLHSQKRDDRDFKSNVTEFIRHMNSENSDFKIQIYCLQYLKELFQNNRDDLNDMICRLTMDPVIEELLHILVKNCKNTTNEMLQLATAECFGELGAIEPTLQQQKYTNQEEFPEEIHDIEFAKLALYQLCRSYQLKNDAKHIDALSLAIQELLKDQKVTKENHDEMEVWKIIPKKMRSQIEPLLTSKYAPKTSEPSDKFPIFWTQLQTAMDWIMRWSGELISRIVEHPSNTKDLLESIKPSMKHNQHITSLFFPYIILHHLEFDSSLIESQNPLRTEIDFIFAVILKREIFEQQHEAKKQKKPLYVKEFDFVPMKVSDQLLKNNMKIEAVKAAKIIFEAFDFLENYRRRGIKPELVRRVNLFLDSFDLEEMAEVNYECGEYARAMIYLENALKKQSGEEFQDKLSFLTQIYVKLENPDSVEGIQALKTTERSLEEKILISNVTGKYQDLAASFERMMQIGEAKIEHIQSMINTYILLDQPQTALVVYEEMIKKIYNSSEKLACDEIKAEPLWRLSRFDELEELISDKTIQKSSNWGLRCGNLLLRFRSEDDQSDINNVNFFDELNTARLAVMNNLMISGSEQTSYGSNYTEVVHLHLINEFEKAGNALNIIKKTNSVDRAMSILKNLFDEWTTRME
ncbi:CLUMA_CG012059, isoform A, partial [Clunio marinus]